MVSIAVTTMLEDYLIKQRIDTQMKNANNIALQVAPYLLESDAGSMYDIVIKAGDDAGGRFLILSNSGVVQADSFSALNGVKLSDYEIDAVIYDQNTNSYNFHQVFDQAAGTSIYTLNCTSAIVSNGQIIGAVLYSSSISDVIRATGLLGVQMVWMYVLACVVIVVFSALFTGFITKPVKVLTDMAVKISSGDFTQRAQIKGKNEMAELGRTFDMMSDRLQNIDQQRSQFVSDASHELKTPLASMKILVESLLYQDDVPAEMYKEFLTDINGEIDRMTNLITDLLLLSKMEGDETLNIENVELAEIVEKSFSALLPIADKREIDISYSIADDVSVQGDALKLRQAISNLMENAVKYTQDGGTVEVVIRKQGSEAYVSVTDNGIGIATGHLPHIFERFYRVDKARARDTGGTGLGLHIVRRIALLHGGRVDVESEEGKGTTFTLVLPLIYKKPAGEQEEDGLLPE